MEWTQKGFAVISDVPQTGMPFLHRFCLSQFDVDQEMRSAAELPENLRLNLLAIPAALHFGD